MNNKMNTMKMAALLLTILCALAPAARAEEKIPAPPAEGDAGPFRQNLDTFRLELTYFGESDKPFYNVLMSVPKLPDRLKANPFDLQGQLKNEEAIRVIDCLHRREFFKNSTVIDPLVERERALRGPAYILTVSIKRDGKPTAREQIIPLEQAAAVPGGSFIDRMKHLAAVVEGDNARNMKTLLGRHATRIENDRVEGEAVKADGVSFSTVTHKKWLMPSNKTDLSVVALELRIVSSGDRSVQFSEFDTLRIVLVDADGKPLQIDGGRDGTRIPPLVTAHLNLPGRIDRQAQLRKDEKAGLRLYGTDPSGGVWHFDGLKEGKYKISFIYDTTNAKQQGAWKGTVETKPVEIEIVK